MTVGRAGKGGNATELLHISTFSGVLACLMRHFRASLASLPLLGQPIGNLRLGTWQPSAVMPDDDSPSSSSVRKNCGCHVNLLVGGWGGWVDQRESCGGASLIFV